VCAAARKRMQPNAGVRSPKEACAAARRRVQPNAGERSRN